MMIKPDDKVWIFCDIQEMADNGEIETDSADVQLCDKVIRHNICV
jgi:hypothetical protein